MEDEAESVKEESSPSPEVTVSVESMAKNMSWNPAEKPASVPTPSVGSSVPEGSSSRSGPVLVGDSEVGKNPLDIDPQVSPPSASKLQSRLQTKRLGKGQRHQPAKIS